jgi:hypothetical protein
MIYMMKIDVTQQIKQHAAHCKRVRPTRAHGNFFGNEMPRNIETFGGWCFATLCGIFSSGTDFNIDYVGKPNVRN